jgi:hypothetical protein
MSRASLIRFVAGIAVTAVIVHAVIAVAAALALDQLYPHRIFNVRAWAADGAERFHLVGSFLVERAQPEARPVVAFIGSSVAYGYPWHERFVASQAFAARHPGYKVINPSIVAADISGLNDFVLCAAARNGIRFEAAVIEIPIVNTTSHMVDAHRQGHPWGLRACDPRASADPGYLRLAMTSPKGIGWLRFLWNSDSNQVEDSVSIGPVPPDYFASAANFAAIRSNYVDNVAALLRNSQRVAARVYAFPSPIYLGGLAKVGENPAAIQHQLETTVAACGSVPGVICVDTSALWWEIDNYYNFTHLSKAGNRVLAEMLGRALAMMGDRTTTSN